jgi:hypothetical protein
MLHPGLPSVARPAPRAPLALRPHVAVSLPLRGTSRASHASVEASRADATIARMVLADRVTSDPIVDDRARQSSSSSSPSRSSMSSSLKSM